MANSYKKIIKDLGVEISEQKTHVSSNMYEFAKRWYRDSVEISGIPIQGFLESAEFWWRLPPAYAEAKARTGDFNSITAPRSFSKVLNILGCHPRFGVRCYMTQLVAGGLIHRNTDFEMV